MNEIEEDDAPHSQDFLNAKQMFACRRCGYNSKSRLRIIVHTLGKYDCHPPPYLLAHLTCGDYTAITRKFVADNDL